MARVPLNPPATPLTRLAARYCRRAYGKVLDPLLAMGHHRGVLLATSVFELAVGRWKRLDPGLKALAVMASAASIGCSWCMDFGYWENRQHGMAHEKLRDVPRWRDSDVYTPLERDVMEYAEAMTATPPTVDDALVERLRTHLDDAQLVELTQTISVENLRSRTNAALGLASQGFKDSCDIPAEGSPGRPAGNRVTGRP
ncbi:MULTISPECIES: carboxymuconolactone decarboxylase family protein [Streptomyces]|uniref:carboxymuconolactone decarboxylase family protein n=1 Tax=Streptomyces TaxID=1883 RepID=UPI00163CCAC3|nr:MULTISPECIES: carboxymuconolactone decarboxylase family protein [Streptomyces]MBC2875624.1 carboxymuconolactone decarboxylase family protein [Streptomyces sp. TYQ1024]UBI35855.1 carboxymuconolactone decarboxylase family protein [Streptomyces mobaraensis]UKW28449.1 carboxymuconolactone decarboxylase family protein [Streptomyces sp. TYQ1024]